MNCYKLETGVTRVYRITTKEAFEESIKGDSKYLYKGQDGYLRGLGICPLCDNPVRIIGLYKRLDSKKPHAIHCKDNNDLKLVSFDKEKYLHCPYSNPNAKQQFDKAKDKYPITLFEKELCKAVRDNFDKIIFFIAIKTDVYISKSFAKILLEAFYHGFGFRLPLTNFCNLPWVLLDSVGRFNLIGRAVKKDSSLWNYLNMRKDIKLTPFDYDSRYEKIESISNKFVFLEMCFYAHSQHVNENDEIIEKIKCGLVDSKDIKKDWVYNKVYKINSFDFQNFCVETNYKNQDLLNIARNVMLDL